MTKSPRSITDYAMPVSLTESSSIGPETRPSATFCANMRVMRAVWHTSITNASRQTNRFLGKTSNDEAFGGNVKLSVFFHHISVSPGFLHVRTDPVYQSGRRPVSSHRPKTVHPLHTFPPPPCPRRALMQLIAVIIAAAILATFVEVTETESETATTVVTTVEAQPEVAPAVESPIEVGPRSESATDDEVVSIEPDAVDSADPVVEPPAETDDNDSRNELPGTDDVASKELETLFPIDPAVQDGETEQAEELIVDDSIIDGPIDETAPESEAAVEQADEPESSVGGAEESVQPTEAEAIITDLSGTDEVEDASLVEIDQPANEDVADHDLNEESSEVDRLVEAWPQLNEHTRETILMLLEADEMTRD